MEEKSIDISKYLLHTSQDEEDFNSIHADLSSLTLNDRDNSHLKLITALSFAETSKELQAKISNETDPLQIQSIFINLKGYYANLIYGKNSNYFMSCLIKKLNSAQKIEILTEIQCEIVKMSIHEYGSHPIQCFIENISSNKEISILLSSLSNKYKFVLICNNSNGTHVIQKLIANITERSRNALSELILGNINMIINDMNGVCVVVKNILHCEDISMLKSIVCVISNNITMYSNNKYSNYAVQALIRKLER